LDDVPAGAAIRALAKPHQQMGYDYDEASNSGKKRTGSEKGTLGVKAALAD